MLPTLLLLLLAAPPDARPPVKLASPGFSGLDVSQAQASFLSDHFAQQLTLRGMQVITSNQIGALLGFERQKQLLGCSEGTSACMAELAAALGVDGVITGSIGKFDQSFQVNISIVSSKDGTTLAAISRNVSGNAALLEALNQAAEQMGRDLLQKLGRAAGPPVPARPVAAAPPSPPSPAQPRPAGGWSGQAWIPAAAGLAAGGAGGLLLLLAGDRAGQLIDAARNPALHPLNASEATQLAVEGRVFEYSGLALVGLGLAGMGAAGYALFSGGPAPVAVQLGPGSAGVTVQGRWP